MSNADDLALFVSQLREAVNQLVTYRDDTKLLLAAPSNAAADVLCGSLDLPAGSVLRLNAMSRRLVDVAKNVVRFCVMSEDDPTKFACPELDEINKYRVVVVTCMSASMLTQIGVKKGHFTHIIIDEVRFDLLKLTFTALEPRADPCPSPCRLDRRPSRKVRPVLLYIPA